MSTYELYEILHFFYQEKAKTKNKEAPWLRKLSFIMYKFKIQALWLMQQIENCARGGKELNYNESLLDDYSPEENWPV